MRVPTEDLLERLWHSLKAIFFKNKIWRNVCIIANHMGKAALQCAGLVAVPAQLNQICGILGHENTVSIF